GIDGSGNVTAGWTEQSGGNSAMQTARFAAGGSAWSSAATLDGGNLYNQIAPKMVVAPSGAVTVAWQESTGGGKYSIQSANLEAGATTWTAPVTLNGGSQTPNAFGSSMTQQINLGVDASNNVTVTWLENLSSTIGVQAAHYTAPHY